jgi:hypothetical protein
MDEFSPRLEVAGAEKSLASRQLVGGAICHALVARPTGNRLAMGIIGWRPKDISDFVPR